MRRALCATFRVVESRTRAKNGPPKCRAFVSFVARPAPLSTQRGRKQRRTAAVVVAAFLRGVVVSRLAHGVHRCSRVARAHPRFIDERIEEYP
jgi:hypothetical protein